MPWWLVFITKESVTGPWNAWREGVNREAEQLRVARVEQTAGQLVARPSEWSKVSSNRKGKISGESLPLRQIPTKHFFQSLNIRPKEFSKTRVSLSAQGLECRPTAEEEIAKANSLEQIHHNVVSTILKTVPYNSSRPSNTRIPWEPGDGVYQSVLRCGFGNLNTGNPYEIANSD